MRKIVLIIMALAAVTCASAFALAAEKVACTEYYTNCQGGEGAVMGHTMTYTLSRGRATVTTKGYVTGEQTCVARKVRTAYAFDNCKGLLQFAIYANGNISMSDSDGCYAYYRCEE